MPAGGGLHYYQADGADGRLRPQLIGATFGRLWGGEMNCPHCKTEALTRIALDENLPAYVCKRCGGNWISSREYWRWLEAHGPTLPEKAYEGPDIAPADTQEIKICPECKHLMLRYKVGHGTGIALDQCGGCNGLWLDGGEWDALKGRNLHDEVHLVFTAPWQSAVRREESRTRLEAIHRRRLGEDYEEVKRIRTWIDRHPERAQILAFLTDPDPYSP
jgi:Zn-finger nucleic acid-binding protein